MQCQIESIIVAERVRKELGDLSSLMASMEKHGQLSPIVVTRKYELVAGHRRLESARRLGWQAVDIIIVDGDTPADRLEMELEENVHRKDFSPEELLAGYTRLERLKRPTLAARVGGFFRRIGDWFAGIFRRKPRQEPRPEPAPVRQPVAEDDDAEEFNPV
jgi:ParB family chromosome partitioning protein